MAAFVEGFHSFCSFLLPVILRTGQLPPEALQPVTVWLEGHAAGRSRTSEQPIVQAVSCGLVKVVTVGKGVNEADAKDEVNEGVSVRTWQAWAEENEQDLARLTELF